MDRKKRFAGAFDALLQHTELAATAAAKSDVDETRMRELIPIVADALWEILGPNCRSTVSEALQAEAERRTPRGSTMQSAWMAASEKPVGTGRSLASGTPGSRTPIMDADPTRGHSHSIAASNDPHADKKLSSTTGISSVREGQTLAEGKPGSSRPLADAGGD